ncbi:FAD-dependent monooxygenase [Microbacterium sp. X-17]|uniref:FAD-dependent monooxygenase n=1 Tax=Microbacterium sp. X-17 TaxID=3144404 RepID=UPI0031F58F0D
MTQIETEVLIVGAGLTGATAAVALARHGIDTMMVSRSAWVAGSPRAHITNQRTMEVLRSLGLEEASRAVATPGELMANLPMMTSLAGLEFGRMWTWGNDPARAGEYAAASPGTGCDLPQNRVEPILVGEAMRRGVEVRFHTSFIALEQDAEGVTTTLHDALTDTEITVRSRYVIGADGGRSAVAEALGLPMSGTDGLSPALNVHVRADLSRYVADRPGSIFWVLQPGREGAMGNAIVRMVRPWTEWMIGFAYLDERMADGDLAQIEAEVRGLIGDDTIDIEILDTFAWRINNVVAEEYRDARVLCAGDAVHRHPPTSGLGGNTCVQDAFNLAWKLAAVLRWGAGDALLDTFTAERQPVGRVVVDRSIASWRHNPEVVRSLGIDPTAPAAERQAAFEVLFEDSDAGERRRAAFQAAKRARDYSYHAHGTEMNHHYASSAVIDDGTPPVDDGRDPELHFQMSSRPGSRIPHAWVGLRGRTVSTLDLCGAERFTLLARARGAAWLTAAEEVSRDLGVPIAALRIGAGGEVADLYGRWGELAEIGETGALLVRPDQHVGWRIARLSEDPRAALDEAMRAILSIDFGEAARLG